MKYIEDLLVVLLQALCAGAVVTKVVAENSIVVGIPVKMLSTKLEF